MSYVTTAAGALLLLAVAGCTGSNMAQQAPMPAPSGLSTAGSAGITGGPAAAPAGAGVVGKSSY